MEENFETDYLYPNTTGFYSSPYGYCNSWVNPSAAYVEDGINRATDFAVLIDDNSMYKYQSYGNFNIDIPSGYSIGGFMIQVGGGATAVYPLGLLFYCSSNNSYYGNETQYFSGNDPDEYVEETFYFGMQTAPMTRTDLDNDHFKIILFSGGLNNGAAVFIDYVKIKVYYFKPADLSISIEENSNISENFSMQSDKDIQIEDSIQIGESPVQIYDGISYKRAVSDQVPYEDSVGLSMTWRHKWSGYHPEGKTQRFGE